MASFAPPGDDIDVIDDVPASAGADTYTFGLPVITSIEPAGGPLQGGNTIKIIGSGFEDPNLSLDSVSFDGIAAGSTSIPTTGASVVSDTEIDVTAPDATSAAGGAATFDSTVDVEFDDSTDPAGPTVPAAPAALGDDEYDFGAPVVTSVEPGAGPLQGGNSLQIFGSGFQNPALSFTGVDFTPLDSSGNAVGSPIAGVSPVVVSDTEIDVTAPDGTSAAAGATSFDSEAVAHFTDTGGSSATVDSAPGSADSDLYTFGAPVIDAITPAAGPLAGGGTVKITGSGFKQAGLSFAGVTFTPDGTSQDLDATNAVVVSDTEIDATVPNATSVANGVVTFDAQVSANFDVTGSAGETDDAVANSPGDDTYSYGAPVVDSISPAAGPLTGGSTVKIIGSGFQDPSLTFAGVSFTPDAAGTQAVNGINAVVVSDTEIDVTTPDVSPQSSGSPSLAASVTALFDDKLAPSEADDSVPAATGDDGYQFGSPVVDSVSPSNGPITGGGTITITGSGFQNYQLSFAGVTFTPSTPGAAPLAGVDPTVVSDTSITVTVPDGTFAAKGQGGFGTEVTADFTVAGSPGSSDDSTPAAAGDDAYSYGGPVVDGVLPATGPLRGGNMVEILGSGFQTANLSLTSVAFDPGGGQPTLAGKNPVVVSDTEIDVTAPDASPASNGQPIVDTGVSATFTSSVTGGTVTTAPSAAGADTYLFQTTATISHVTFSGTPAAPKVTITGVGFGTKPSTGPGCLPNNTDYANFDLYVEDVTTGTTSGAPGNCIGLHIVSFSDVKVVATFGSEYKYYPPLAAGDQFALDVWGATDTGTVAYATPVVTAVKPSSGADVGGTKVVISGALLTGATQVMFGSTPATSVSVNAAGTAITAYTPAEAPGTVDVTVTTGAGGTSATGNSDQYTFEAPALSSIAPLVGRPTGGTRVVIRGVAFNGATEVLFGTTPAPAFSVNAAGTIVIATSPPGSPGPTDVTVVTPGGTTKVVKADRFDYSTISKVAFTGTAAEPTVTVTGVALGPKPTAQAGPCGGSNPVYEGNALVFEDVTTGTSSGSPYTCVGLPIVSWSSSKIVFGFGDYYAGFGELSDGDTFTLGVHADSFTGVVEFPNPVISAMSPSMGPTGGGTPVTITGTGFSQATEVTFGGVDALTFAVNAAGTQITATAPPGSPGTVPVAVTTPNGRSARVAADLYTYVAGGG